MMRVVTALLANGIVGSLILTVVSTFSVCAAMEIAYVVEFVGAGAQALTGSPAKFINSTEANAVHIYEFLECFGDGCRSCFAANCKTWLHERLYLLHPPFAPGIR